MRYSFRSLLVAPACLVAACVDGLEPLPARPSSELRFIEVGSFNRSFHLVAGQKVSSPRPLLIVYHGAGDAAANIMNNTGLAAAASKAGVVSAFPDAVEGYGARWATNPVDLQVVDDLEFTRALIDNIDEDVPIDRSRIFIAGYSRGGDLVFQLLCRAPDLARAGVAIAATTLETQRDWCNDTKELANQPSLAVIMGSADPIMPWDGTELRMGALETGDFFAARNGCRTAAATETAHPAYDGFTVRRFSWEPCSKANVQLFRVAPLGHDWPSRAFEMESMIVQWLLAQ